MAAHQRIVSAAWMVAVMVLANPAVAAGPKPPPAAIAGGQKVCSAVVPDVFRDSINVPASWTAEACAEWARSIRAQHYQLGCFFEMRKNSPSFAWGESAAFNGNHKASLPSANCGW